MSIDPLGLATLAVGLLCLALVHHAAVIVFMITMLLGSAAAAFVGSANITPAHMFLGILAIAVLTRRDLANATLQSVMPPRPGFWLALLVAYGVASGYLLPRIFAGETAIVALGSSQYADTGSTVPLGPVSGNITQSIYFIGDLLCFCLVIAAASTPRGYQAVVAGLLAYCVGNTLFAFLDLGTYLSGTAFLLDPIRNSTYALHVDTEVHGLKRIVGSFTESSAFARSTLGVLGLTATLWLFGIRPALTATLAVVSVFLVVLSTSSAGLVGTIPVLAIVYLTAVGQAGLRRTAKRSALLVLLVPPVALLVIALGATIPAIFETVRDYAEVIVLTKMTSASGIERSFWNEAAMTNFFDTGGLGVGLGTARTSSLSVALISNVGVIGTALYVMVILTAFKRPSGPEAGYVTAVRTACRNACIGLLVGDLLVGTVVDQGLFFYALAGAAAARPLARAPSLAHRAPLIPHYGRRPA